MEYMSSVGFEGENAGMRDVVGPYSSRIKGKPSTGDLAILIGLLVRLLGQLTVSD
jgi:hypothetical protein